MQSTILMTTSYKDWVNHAQVLEDVDQYASFLMAYIGLVVFCIAKFGASHEFNLPNGELSSEFQNVYSSLTATSKYITTAQKINDFFEKENNIRYYLQDGSYRPFRFKADDFENHVIWMGKVRNNLVHGRKDFESRSNLIVAYANELILALFSEIIDR